MVGESGYHLIALAVLTTAQTWYYFYLPTAINGYYQATSGFVSQVFGIVLPSPFGNLPYAFTIGLFFSAVYVYGFLLLAFLFGIRTKHSRARRGATAITTYLFGWLISTAAVVVFIYAVGPFFGWAFIPQILQLCNSVNWTLSALGATWFGFNCQPPPPFIVTSAPQFILYWASLTLTTLAVIGAINLMVLGFLYKAAKKGAQRA